MRELLRACYYATDKKPLSEAPLSFAEKEILKIAVKKVKGTDIELLLKENGFIELKSEFILTHAPQNSFRLNSMYFHSYDFERTNIHVYAA